MRRYLPALVLVSSSLLFACGGAEPEPVAPPPPPPPPPVAVVAPPPADTTPPPPPELTAEEKKKAADLKELQDERAKWQDQNKAELARWTPELHASAKALVKPYPTLKAAMTAALAGPQRKPGDADRDKYRHPLETLAFFGLTPSMTVLEVSPGEGWYTELLAPVLGARGALVETGSDPSGPDTERRTFYAQRFKALLDKAPEVFGKTKTIVVDGKSPKLAAAGQVDMVLLMREVHGMVNSGTLGAWLSEIHEVLKPGGVLGIEEHRANPDADPVASSKKGYVPEKWVIDQVTAAGFKLAGKSEINANAKDTKDYAEGVWTLPPSLELGDKDREKYMAIGESDRMTLKFVKVAVPAAKPPPPPAKK